MSKIDFPEDGWSGDVQVGFRDRTPRGGGGPGQEMLPGAI